MKALDDLVIRYIEDPQIQGALLIKGEWGIGKTYYFKKKLKKLIEGKGKFILYISLNGIANSSELRRTLLTTAFLGVNEKEGQIISSFKEKLRKLIKTFEGISPVVNKFDLSDFINLKEGVVVFDDLERVSNKFLIGDLLGFINTQFIEHKGYKVILIGDEGKKQLRGEDYHKIKEKVINWSIEYSPNMVEIFSDIISYYSKEKSTYSSFLEEKKEMILEIVNELSISNIRIVNYVFYCLESIFDLERNEHKELGDDLIYFVCVICNEYKRGRLSPFISEKKIPECIKDRKIILADLTISDFANPSSEVLNEEKSKEEQYTDEFDFYKKNNFLAKNHDIRYTYFEPIFKFITSGIMDLEQLRKSIHEYNEIKSFRSFSKNYTLIKKLEGYRNLTNQEFKSKVQKLIGMINDGSLIVYDYAYASSLLLRFSKIELLDMEIEALKKLLICNVGKTIDNPIEVIDTYSITYTEELEREFPELVQRITEIEDHIHTELTKVYAQQKFNNWTDYKNLDNMTLILSIIPENEVVEYVINVIKERKHVEGFHMTFSVLCKRKQHLDKPDRLTKIKDILIQKANKLELIDRHWINLFINEIVKNS